MPTSDIISIVIVVLVVSVIGIAVFSRKEKNSTQRRQELANCRLRAEKAQELHDSLSALGLEKIAYRFLLQRVVENYEKAHAIDGAYPGLNKRLIEAREALANLEQTEYYADIPTGATELQSLVTQLSKFIQYINQLFERRIVPENIYQDLMPSLQRTMLKINTESHMKVAHKAANEGQFGTARQSLQQARNILLDFNPEDSFVIQKVSLIEDTLASLTQLENSSVVEEETATITDNEIHCETSMTVEEKVRSAAMDQAELNRLNEETGGHEVKKMW